MKIDLYTKFILTVIAGCLLTISFRMLQNPPAAAAQNDGLRVVISGVDVRGLAHGVPVSIVPSADNVPVPVTLGGGGRDTVPVTVMNPLVPVSVMGSGREARQAVPVNVVQVNTNNLGPAGVPTTATTPTPVNVTQVAGGEVTKEGVPVVPRR
jgi:hypothetical protein